MLSIGLAAAALHVMAAGTASREVVPFPSTPAKEVPAEAMRKVYEEVKTPYKYGVVLRGDDGQLVDSPSIFRSGKRWYMLYLTMNKVGYETHLAASDDLLHWEKQGRILSFQPDGWDKWQDDGGIALCDYRWEGTHALQRFDGRYWLSYIGGALQGYETDPLSIGMAWTRDPTQAREWTRIAGNPVLSPSQPDVRPFERKTLYRSNIIYDRSRATGWPFVMFYNGKYEDGFERIGMAVSRDMLHWSRFGAEPVIDNGRGISGDPQIARIGDVWVMFYFGAFWKPAAFDTFACSYDLIHWTRWQGPHLTEPTTPWDKQYAHKPWVLKHEGVVYHFYCAVGDQGRVIALATSKDLGRAEAEAK